MKNNTDFLLKIFIAFILFAAPSLGFADAVFRLNFEEGDLPSLHPHVLQGHARGRVLAMLSKSERSRFRPSHPYFPDKAFGSSKMRSFGGFQVL